jgi:hypothetical protein
MKIGEMLIECYIGVVMLGMVVYGVAFVAEVVLELLGI